MNDHVAAILDDVARAGAVVAPSWPLSSTIAVNPVAGFEDRPFRQALIDAAGLFGTRGVLSIEELRLAHRRRRIDDADLLDAIDRAIPGLEADRRRVLFLDLTQGPPEPAPRRTRCTVAEGLDQRDGTDLAGRMRLALAERCTRGELPGGLDEPVDDGTVELLCQRLQAALDRLEVPASRRLDHLERHVSLLPGWASHLRWRERAGQTHVLLRFLVASTELEADLVAGRATFALVEHLQALEVAPLEARASAVAEALGAPQDHERLAGTLARLQGVDRVLVWQDAYERAVHDAVLASVEVPERSRRHGALARPEAQVVCCIDVRAEVLRRHLEATGPYETFGYAGFFGLAVRAVPAGGGEATEQCPVLLEPSGTITVDDGGGRRRRLGAGAEDAWQSTKHHPVAPLALAEGAGWVAGPIAALRTALAGRGSGRHGRRTSRPPVPDVSTIPLTARADVVEGVLRLGIAARLAPLVVLCAHTSHAANNPTESGLTCGACGGHGGAPNAVAVAAMANDPAVRAELDRRGLAVPDDTWFVAAEHDTALDHVRILGPVPASHAGRLATFVRDVRAAGDATTAERSVRLPGAGGAVRRTRRRPFDWAEPLPELGLAGNAAFVVGPRSMTAGSDLGGRVFLHSYEPDGDPDGATLGAILTAPLVVAQWINAQYHFSTTDPEVFGAGSKALHNVLGDIGLLSGPGGDLRRGLALQSVRAGDRLLHEPVRLLAVLHGRREHVDAAIDGSAVLRQLVEHEWVHLVVRQPGEASWWQRTAAGWSQRTPGPLGVPVVAGERSA